MKDIILVSKYEELRNMDSLNHTREMYDLNGKVNIIRTQLEQSHKDNEELNKKIHIVADELNDE